MNDLPVIEAVLIAKARKLPALRSHRRHLSYECSTPFAHVDRREHGAGTAHAVEYSGVYPLLNWVSSTFGDDLVTALLPKHSGWKYEQESRLVFPEKPRQFLPFRPEALSAIVVGCRAKNGVIAKLNELLAERTQLGLPKPALYKAVQHESQYRLVVKSL